MVKDLLKIYHLEVLTKIAKNSIMHLPSNVGGVHYNQKNKRIKGVSCKWLKVINLRGHGQ